VLRKEHFVRENPARFTEPRGVERLKSVFNQLADVGAAAGTVIPDGTA
jgi:hypothetical protein